MIAESQVRQILAHPFDHDWSIQGFGMLRMYTDAEQTGRLHIWDPTVAVDEVSQIHDHPWDFTSRIVYGTLVNQRYARMDGGCECHPYTAEQMTRHEVLRSVRIETGEDAAPFGPPEELHVLRRDREAYFPGDSYRQEAPELHESLPAPGCVTLIDRKMGSGPKVATSAWRGEGSWVSAAPRPASKAEILHFVNLAGQTARTGDGQLPNERVWQALHPKRMWH